MACCLLLTIAGVEEKQARHGDGPGARTSSLCLAQPARARPGPAPAPCPCRWLQQAATTHLPAERGQGRGEGEGEGGAGFWSGGPFVCGCCVAGRRMSTAPLSDQHRKVWQQPHAPLAAAVRACVCGSCVAQRARGYIRSRRHSNACLGPPSRLANHDRLPKWAKQGPGADGRR